MSRGPRTATTVFIFITVALDVLALGVVIPVLPKLIEQFLGGDTARAAEINGGFSTAWALMQFIFSPLLGALSDRFGRRPVILISCLGLGLDYLLMAVAPTLGWLFVGRLISGITAASFATAGAYIADVTPSERRAAAFGMIGAAWGIGFIIGPAFGGLLGSISPRAPFWAAGALALCNFCYGFFVLPESLPPERRVARFSWARANPVGALKLLRSHHELFGLAGVNALYWFAHYALPATFVLYSGHRYGWDTRMVGLTLAGAGVMNLIVQTVLIRCVTPRIGERRTLMVGLAAGVLGFLGYGLAPTGPWFWAALPIAALMGFFTPALQTLMTRHVSSQEQGQLQGANGSISAIVGLVAPATFSFAFARGIDPASGWNLPGAAMLLAAATLAAAFALAWRVTRRER